MLKDNNKATKTTPMAKPPKRHRSSFRELALKHDTSEGFHSILLNLFRLGNENLKRIH